ncbi:MAG: hypothetical protein K2X77_05965 [Candidatus Obscuribacterales bacterium]|jgi:hypothetical protein|nr:hypothetical protein [Candidatus Obscuribacterales bacterium]
MAKASNDRNSNALKAKECLLEYGLLLLQDQRFPSLVGIVVGEPVSGSWWGHPKGSEIFKIASEWDDDADIVTCKLVSGKVTFVHRKLWAHLVAIGKSEEAWQTDSLSEEANSMFAYLKEHKSAETNALPQSLLQSLLKPGKACDELEKRLLVCAQEFHTESGAHAKRVMTWTAFEKSKQIDSKVNLSDAKRDFEKLLADINKSAGSKAKLPWK